MLISRVSRVNWLRTIQIPGFCSNRAIADYWLLFACLFLNLGCLFVKLCAASAKTIISAVPYMCSVSLYIFNEYEVGSYLIPEYFIQFPHRIDIIYFIISVPYRSSISTTVSNYIFVSVSFFIDICNCRI